MPQMMPLIWFFMIITMIFLMIIIMSYIYYLYLPSIILLNKNTNKLLNWSWKW